MGEGHCSDKGRQGSGSSFRHREGEGVGADERLESAGKANYSYKTPIHTSLCNQLRPQPTELMTCQIIYIYKVGGGGVGLPPFYKY